MPRTIFAFNGDLESRLALHWLVHERGHEVVALSLNLGQEIYLEPLGELALDLGAVSAQVLDQCRDRRPAVEPPSDPPPELGPNAPPEVLHSVLTGALAESRERVRGHQDPQLRAVDRDLPAPELEADGVVGVERLRHDAGTDPVSERSRV